MCYNLNEHLSFDRLRLEASDINPSLAGLREWVALDLETTGLNSRSDDIIEIGAVRFSARGDVAEYQSLVNPGRRLPRFIRQLTGISQREVDAAPDFDDIADEVADFLRGATVIAHNAPFDMGFLNAAGLDYAGPVCDTWDLAYLARPAARSYALEELARAETVSHTRPHRALEDARAVRDLFLALMPDFAALDAGTLAEIRRLASRSRWDVAAALLDSAEEFAPPRPRPPANLPAPLVGGRELARRLAQPPAIRAAETADPIDVRAVSEALSAGSPFAASVPGFEERPQQIEMAQAVAETVNAGARLIVEAGTGVGKSLAYLLPAAIYAVQNGKRVVVSTNTINLQEQLIGKDLPMLKAALAEIAPEIGENLRFSQLKGRANYLCYKRWRQTRASPDLEPDQARAIAKTLLWMPDTRTGDRSEINLGHRGTAAAWDRMSAGRARDCPDATGPCFLRAARESAWASHIVVVNHALLTSDLAYEGSSIPDYDILVIDEAHNFEDAATDQLSWRVEASSLDEILAELGGERGLLAQTAAAVSDPSKTEAAGESAALLHSLIPRLREETSRLFGALIPDAAPAGRRTSSAFPTDTRVTDQQRAAPAWEEARAGWENFDILMGDAARALAALVEALEPDEDAPPEDAPAASALSADLTSVAVSLSGLRAHIAKFISEPSEDVVYWVTRPPSSADVLINGAPLSVGALLQENLYDEKEAVIMTSATLSVGGAFDHVTERLGFADARGAALGSPFDFYEAALIYAPPDMPNPNAPDFAERAGEVIADAAIAAGGRSMALFTSHAALRATDSAVRGRLAQHGIQTLAQGVDGPPQRVAARFVERPESVLLGAASFWEGIDFAGDSLTVLTVTRLPFTVPSDPVFQARSERYKNPFMEYAVPQAIIRFKQGFGRLIRTGQDRGVAIVLDSRIVTRRYGRLFTDSLPKTRVTNGRGYPVSDIITKWMERPV